MYKIIENDVRLIRRGLVCLNCKEYGRAKRIFKYLREKGLELILPSEQSNAIRERYYRMLNSRDLPLATAYGMVVLPQYNDAIFLNSEWRNPKTLYVRLVDEVPELDELGYLVWSPDINHIPTLDELNRIYKDMREKRMRPPTVWEKFKANLFRR